MMRVLSVFGTRPEAIKMAPVVQALDRAEGVISRTCVTGQHREMLDQVLNLFDIRPDWDLNIMRPGQGLNEVAAAIFSQLDPILRDEAPDWLIVQGDTATAMAAALAGYFRRVRVGHVEAGIRTGDKWNPFPEEINRKVIDVVGDRCFAPTALARQNLLAEGVPEDRIVVTGNTVVDALRAVVERPRPPALTRLLADAGITIDGGIRANGAPARLVLVTAHRRESFGAPMERICAALREIVATLPDVCIVFPVHLNPNVRGVVYRDLGDVPRVVLTEPLEYAAMAHLLRVSTIVLTDSGGLQEEAPTFGVPTLVMREKTERVEAIEAGTARLVGTDRTAIVGGTIDLLTNPEAHARMARAGNPFGDGHASDRIVTALRAAG